MTPEQQNRLVKEILQFTMPDGSPVSNDVKAEVIISELGLPPLPQLRHLIAIGAARFAQRARSRLRADQ